MTERIGQYIGNYRLLRLLGQGGLTQIYLGEHRYLKSAAALKVLQHSLTEQQSQHFQAEAQVLSRLRHPHIVRVLDFAVEQGMAVLVMDYIPGGTLRQRHPRGTRLSMAMTVEYVKQVASALQYAHNHHVIHRNVKPGNLLLDSDDRLVLSDFSLALFAPSPDLLSTQALAGTLSYIAPEQARGRPCFASDQYALGVLTYEWMAGVPPFEGRAFELIEQHLTVAPPPLREHSPDLPMEVSEVVLRALAKNPQERYVSVSAFAQALERVCQGSKQSDDDFQITAPLLATAPSLPPSGATETMPTLQTIFLSSAPSDEQAAVRFAADLKRRGLLLSNDLRERASFAEQEDTVRQAMRAVHYVIVVLTPQTSSSRIVREHLRLASLYQRRLVLVWIEGDEMEAMLLSQEWVSLYPADLIDARGDRYQTALEELLVCLRDDTRVFPDEEVTFSLTSGELRNPYKGLLAFGQEDALDFFGRDALIEEMMEQLGEILAEKTTTRAVPRLLSLVGSSGSGKSSVVLAGLVPKLRQGGLPHSQDWIYLSPMVLGPHPIEGLTLIVAALFPERRLKSIHEDLQRDSARALHVFLTAYVKPSGRNVLLVIDQFEELFAQTVTEDERRHFLGLLLTAITAPDGPLITVVTLRADCYDQLLLYPELKDIIEGRYLTACPLSMPDLRAVIEQPAALPDVQLTFEEDLVSDLLFDVQGQVGALPLLQFTLDQLFEHRQGRMLTLPAYHGIGGVKGVLAQHAELTYQSLPTEHHRQLARSLFLRLVRPATVVEDVTRRRVARSELVVVNQEETARLAEVTDAFTQARLLTTNGVGGVSTVEVSHEALVWVWMRLQDWLYQARDDIRLQQALTLDTASWTRHGQPADRLYRGSQLIQALRWRETNLPSLQEDRFLQASLKERHKSIILGVVSIVTSAVVGGGIFSIAQQYFDSKDVTLSASKIFSSPEIGLLLFIGGMVLGVFLIFLTRKVLPFLAFGRQNITSRMFLFAGMKSRKRSLPFFAIARAELEKDDRAIVGKSYTLEAGLAQNRPDRFVGVPFLLPDRQLSDSLWFDLVLHASDKIAVDGRWHQRLHYDPANPDPQLIAFSFHFTTSGRGSVAINFYHEQRWLKTVRLEIETVEQSVENAAITAG